MPNKKKITRRDFLNGIALSIGASSSGISLELLAQQQQSIIYPPALTGLRGAHKGAFEIAHSVAWQGKQWPIPQQQTDDNYDLVVVGGGISGLSAALLFQQQAGSSARILILDCHDDFGGHAKRNEFTVEGKTLITYGGSQSIESPAKYSAASKQLLKDIGIETERFYDYFDHDFEKKWGLKSGLLFSERDYGKNLLTSHFHDTHNNSVQDIRKIVSQYPISERSRTSIIDFLTNKQPPKLPQWSYQDKIANLRKLSYYDYLQQYTPLTNEAMEILHNSSAGVWGVGWDSLSTLEAIRWGMPGTAAIGIKAEDIAASSDHKEPYIFHFPDGNAGIARALVRQLIPSAIPGNNMEDLVLSRANYEALDHPSSSVRIRLNSTAIRVENSTDQKEVNVTYIKNNQSFRVKAKHTILACDNKFIPHICPETPPAQKQALDYAQKVPIVYANVALRNWKALAKSGYSGFYMPKNKLFHSIGLDFPVSMGGYEFSASPEEPAILHASMAPSKPFQGLTPREQHQMGRHQLYRTSFEEYEQNLFQQLSEALGPYGFDPVKDISGITVNRWPHGYAYEYNELFDPVDWSTSNGPHITGRAQMGRISIANADSSAYAYVNGAIDAADRAIKEQIQVT